jgi:hypothetical protein
MNSYIVNCLEPQPKPSRRSQPPARRHQPARACLVGLGQRPVIHTGRSSPRGVAVVLSSGHRPGDQRHPDTRMRDARRPRPCCKPAGTCGHQRRSVISAGKPRDGITVVDPCRQLSADGRSRFRPTTREETSVGGLTLRMAWKAPMTSRSRAGPRPRPTQPGGLQFAAIAGLSGVQDLALDRRALAGPRPAGGRRSRPSTEPLDPEPPVLSGSTFLRDAPCVTSVGATFKGALALHMCLTPVDAGLRQATEGLPAIDRPPRGHVGRPHRRQRGPPSRRGRHRGRIEES